MSIVPSSITQTVKLSLEPEVADRLSQYAQFAASRRAAVVEIALQRLFAADTDWQKHLIETP